jgi:hypothetical protein
MNIYLDIDGVLLIDIGKASNYADEFLIRVISKYPDTTYWLTTHCWRGENRCIDVLRPALKPETFKLLNNVKPTEWGEFKTDAIDFKQPFLWFDDDLFPEEKEVLEAHNALKGHILVDLYEDPNQLQKLIDLL